MKTYMFNELPGGSIQLDPSGIPVQARVEVLMSEGKTHSQALDQALREQREGRLPADADEKTKKFHETWSEFDRLMARALMGR